MSQKPANWSCKNRPALTSLFPPSLLSPRRFILDENINNNTGISIFAIFDGHGGDFAADYAKDVLIQNVYNKIIEAHNIVTGKGNVEKGKVNDVDEDCQQQQQRDENGDVAKMKRDAEDQRPPANGKATMSVAERRNSFRKTTSFTDDSIKKATNKQPDPIDIYRLNHLVRPLNKDDFLGGSGGSGQEKAGKVAPKSLEARCYVEKGKINFGKLLTDEVLAADHKLVETVKKMVRSCVSRRWMAVVDVLSVCMCSE